MKYRAFLPVLALLLLTACGKAELTGISLQPVAVQAGETAEAAVQYETAGKASDTAIQTAVDAQPLDLADRGREHCHREQPRRRHWAARR